MSSGSSRSASGVEPVISANIIVTTRRSSGSLSWLAFAPDEMAVDPDVERTRVSRLPVPGRGSVWLRSCVCSARTVPHSMQNFALGKFTVWQFGQTSKRLPHSIQNLALGGLSDWQFGQRIDILSCLQYGTVSYWFCSILQHSQPACSEILPSSWSDHPQIIERALVDAAGAGVDVGAVVVVVPDHDGGHTAGDDADGAVVAWRSYLPPGVVGG
jgi:hypothetical protein